MISYEDYLQSPEWKKRRAWVLTFWNHRCGICNRKDKLEVHHRTYERLGNELLTDLIPLCDRCHAKFHDEFRPGLEMIQTTLHRVARGMG